VPQRGGEIIKNFFIPGYSSQQSVSWQLFKKKCEWSNNSIAQMQFGAAPENKIAVQ
jgi:hypothetical protein